MLVTELLQRTQKSTTGGGWEEMMQVGVGDGLRAPAASRGSRGCCEAPESEVLAFTPMVVVKAVENELA